MCAQQLPRPSTGPFRSGLQQEQGACVQKREAFMWAQSILNDEPIPSGRINRQCRGCHSIATSFDRPLDLDTEAPHNSICFLHTFTPISQRHTSQCEHP